MLDRTHIQALSQIVRIAFFQEKPQNLPSTRNLVTLTVVGQLLATAAMDVFRTFQENLFTSAVQIVVYGVVIWLVLRFKNKANRWPQTISALFGTGCLIRVISFAPYQIITSTSSSPESAVYWATVTALPFGIWSLCVSAFILKEALETTPVRAFFIAFSVALFVSFVLLGIFGITMTATPGGDGPIVINSTGE